jgi:phosphoenolpyruvate---glycerone phosphotransferase subunit DhaK
MRDSLEGFAAAHSDILKVSFDPVYIVRVDAPVTGKVGIISGGGSGHEPLHGGFVGQGMLDASFRAACAVPATDSMSHPS